MEHCNHTRRVYRDRLNVVLLAQAGAVRAECRACGVPVGLGPSADTVADERGADQLIEELRLAAIIAETLHAETDPKMTPYHWEANIDIALDALDRRDVARSRPRSPIELMVNVACGLNAAGAP